MNSHAYPVPPILTINPQILNFEAKILILSPTSPTPTHTHNYGADILDHEDDMLNYCADTVIVMLRFDLECRITELQPGAKLNSGLMTWRTMVYHGIPWYTMVYYGIPWNTMESRGIPWNTME